MFWLDIQNGTFHGSCGVTFQSTLIFPELVFEILKISCRRGVTVSFRTRCPAGPSVADMLLSAVHSKLTLFEACVYLLQTAAKA
jgi:hypothetical protein